MKTTSKATTAKTGKATTAKTATTKATGKTAVKKTANATAVTEDAPVKEATAPKATAKTTAKPKATTAPKAEKADKPVVTLETAMKNPVAESAIADAIMEVDPRNIVVKPGFNVRNQLGDLADLKQNIKKNGLLMPLVAVKLEGDKWELVDGHRRFEAVTQLIKEGVKINFVDVREFKGNEAQRIVFMVTSGTTQQNLNEMEEADAVQRLIDQKMSVDDIMSSLNISRAHYYNLTKFLSFSTALKQLIYTNQITATTVLHISRREKNEKVQLAVAQAAIKKAEADARRFEKEVKPATKKDIVKGAEQSNEKALSLEAILNRVFIDAEALDKNGKPKKGYILLQALVDGEHSEKAIAKLFNF